MLGCGKSVSSICDCLGCYQHDTKALAVDCCSLLSPTLEHHLLLALGCYCLAPSMVFLQPRGFSPNLYLPCSHKYLEYLPSRQGPWGNDAGSDLQEAHDPSPRQSKIASVHSGLCLSDTRLDSLRHLVLFLTRHLLGLLERTSPASVI